MWSVEEILSATGGKIVRDGGARSFGEIFTDSKKVTKGAVFLALKGERLDGHAFLKGAVRRGAACLVIHSRQPREAPGGATVIQVRDTLRALGDLARYRRMKIAPKVLAITGSNGKTTTKEMVAAILERGSLRGRPLRGSILKTEGNFNNLVGLPLTLLRLKKRDRVAVVELGTSRPGEIARLSEIAAPDIGLVTSVAPAHLAGLSSLAGVAKEKGALYRGLKPDGIAVINLDDPWVRRLGGRFKGEKVTYGRDGDVRAESLEPLGPGGAEFTLRVGGGRRRVRLRLCGEHNLANSLAAAAMARGLGVGMDAMRLGLESMRAFPMRMAVERWGGVGVINDAYNANPASMKAALKALSHIKARGEKIAVLGDMLELGTAARRNHIELGRQAARFGIDRLYLLGAQAGQVKEGAVRGGMSEDRVVVGKSHRQMARMLEKRLRGGDWLLFKGSRGMKMETVLAAVKKSRA
ncbi:MAG: UDP-N-acetylmuramoyl-tripeptide--D-alanyl-D-alanine ligase [Deltaproteobacteria bacterium]|nr:UDP-N-acetylmuramoyl-tripeptide--D-alanyl-D-alanine ligase [Deltaproteobacteria bacterium]